MKNLLLITCTLLFFSSCMTDQKCFEQLDRHGKLPAICAAKFPPQDSIGAIVYLDRPEIPASINYQDTLDLLAMQAAVLKGVVRDKVATADSISNACADVVLSFLNRVDSLEKRIRDLKQNYKPPVTDTLRGIQPHYNLNPPALADCQAKLELSQQALVKANAEKDLYKKYFHISLFTAIGLFLVLALIVFFKFFK